MLSNLTPAQEPVAWGALGTAILELAVIFAPRFGVQISVQEQAALAGLIVAAIPIVVGFFVRQSTTPTAPPPVLVSPTPPTPPSAS